MTVSHAIEDPLKRRWANGDRPWVMPGTEARQRLLEHAEASPLHPSYEPGVGVPPDSALRPLLGVERRGLR